MSQRLAKFHPVLSVCIVSFNTAELTRQSLDSLLESSKQTGLRKIGLEVILVDNNSQDNTLEIVNQWNKNRHHHSWFQLKIIKNKNNLGFAKANNQALAQAKGEYFLLLNSDVIVQKNAVWRLFKTYRLHHNNELGILAAELLNSNRTRQQQGGDLPSACTLFNHFFFLTKLPGANHLLHSTQRFYPPSANSQVRSQGWVGGTAMMFSRRLWQEVGHLDEKIFMYGEDVDYCWRARKLGWQVAVDQTAQIIHLGSASGGSDRAIEGEIVGLNYLIDKHLTDGHKVIAHLILKAGVIFRRYLFSLLNQPNRAAAYNRAWLKI